MSPFRGSDPESIPDALVRYFNVGRRDLVYLKFILEAYEGMSTLSTVEPHGVIVRLSIPAGFEADMESLLAAMRADMPMAEVTFPAEEPINA
jgi:hypothetical protein